MRHVDTLIKARWVIPVDGKQTILEHHAIALDQGKIIDILPNELAHLRYSANQTRYLDHHAILPGFINAHTHVPMNLFRGLADDLKLMYWLKDHIWPAEHALVSKEFVYDGAMHAMAEMIKGGTTCFNDMYFFTLEIAAAAQKAGLRGFVGETVFNLSTPWSPDIGVCFEKNHATLEALEDAHLVRATIAPHAPYTTDAAVLRQVKSIAEDYKVKINIHLQETQAEVDQHLAHHKLRPLAWLKHLGLTNDNLIAVHMTSVTEEDILECAKAKINVVHCPESNMKLSSGICPVQKFLDAGVNVALGTDGAASNNDLDMIGEMRSAAFLAKISSNNPEALPAYKVLQMATINGAKALGIDHITGSLTPGKAADLIAIDLKHIATTPTFNPVSQIVYSANRDQVTDVWVAGKLLMKNKVLTTLNEARIMDQSMHWKERIEKALKQSKKAS